MYVPSTVIDKQKLKTSDEVLAKDRALRTESKAGKLAVQLAREAIFGEDVLTKCTVGGFRNLPAHWHFMNSMNCSSSCSHSSLATGKLHRNLKPSGVQLLRLLGKLAKDYARKPLPLLT